MMMLVKINSTPLFSSLVVAKSSFHVVQNSCVKEATHFFYRAIVCLFCS